MPGRVLDTSSLLAFVQDEAGADDVAGVLEARQTSPNDPSTQLTIPFIALMELEYNLLRRAPSSRVQELLLLIDAWPATVEESRPDWRREAAKLKARYRLSLADAWIASLALVRDAELVHKDPEFDQIAGLKALRLPYKA